MIFYERPRDRDFSSEAYYPSMLSSGMDFNFGDPIDQVPPFEDSHSHFNYHAVNKNHTQLFDDDELPRHADPSPMQSQMFNPAMAQQRAGDFDTPYSQVMNALANSNDFDMMFSHPQPQPHHIVPSNTTLFPDADLQQQKQYSESPSSEQLWHHLRSPESNGSQSSSATDYSVAPNDTMSMPQTLRPKPEPITTSFDRFPASPASTAGDSFLDSPPDSATSANGPSHYQQHQPARRGRKRTTNADTDPVRARQLERNRRAASRCRKKQKKWITELETAAKEGQQRNQELKMQLRQLNWEVVGLREGLLEHSHCEDGRIGRFFESEVGRLTRGTKIKNKAGSPQQNGLFNAGGDALGAST